MFARTVVVVCLLGLIAVSDNCRAQSVDLLVPPKHMAIRRHFATQVAELSKPQPRMVSVQRSARRAVVAWALQVSLAIALPFATQADAQLDQHPTV